MERILTWIKRVEPWLRERGERPSIRRTAAMLAALLLWLGVGGMRASSRQTEIGGGFGDIHWYEMGGAACFSSCASPPFPVRR